MNFHASRHQYIKLKHPKENAVEVTQAWPYYKTWLAPQLDPGGAILGVGANLPFDYVTRCWKRFAERVRLPEHELDHIEQSSTPYRRPPYSFIADGFLVLGGCRLYHQPLERRRGPLRMAPLCHRRR